MQKTFWLSKRNLKYDYIPVFLGIIAIISQILLVREFLFSFYGNELSIGLFLACWLFWTGAGSYVSNYIKSKKRVSLYFINSMFIILPVITFGTISAIKYANLILNVPVGIYSSLLETFLFLAAVLFPVCFLTGFLFTVSVKFLQRENDLSETSNNVYMLESIGSMLGGLLFALVLNKFFSAFEILLLMLQFALVLFFIMEKSSILKYASPVIFLAALFSFVNNAGRFENYITREQWKLLNTEMHFVAERKTDYQTLSLLELNGQHTLFSNGKPLYNINDRYASEMFVHSVFSQSISPDSILIIGGVSSGLISEILKYNVSQVDCVEPDPALLDFTIGFLDSVEYKALKSAKVNIIHSDPRSYVKSATNKYDVIIMNVGDPNTLNANRFFTREFFSSVGSIMNPDAFFVFSILSSEDFMGEDMKNYNASVFHTFRDAFKNYLVIPGARLILIGSLNSGTLTKDSRILEQRFDEALIKTEYFSAFLFDQIMRNEKALFFVETVGNGSEKLINSDKNPVAYYFYIVLSGSLLGGLELDFSLAVILLIAISLYPVSGLIFRLWRYPEKKKEIITGIILLSAAFCLGYTSIMVTLLVLFDFQTLFGSVYIMIGFLFALNMFGLAIGSGIYGLMNKSKNSNLIIIAALTLLFPYSIQLVSASNSPFVSFMVMIIYSALIGFLFASLNTIYMNKRKEPGKVYALDLAGSAFGALITSAFLIPMLGFTNVIFIFYALIAFILLVVMSKKCRSGD